MLSRRQGDILAVVLLAIVVALAVSLATTAMTMRLGNAFIDRWLQMFVVAAAVAVPTALIALPAVRRLTDRFVR